MNLQAHGNENSIFFGTAETSDMCLMWNLLVVGKGKF